MRKVPEVAVGELVRRLLEGLERDFAEVAEKAGGWLVCKPGCDACCHGPFPVTRLDVDRLRRGLERLICNDPGRAAAVVARARLARKALEPGFPGDFERGSLARDESKLDAFFKRHHGLACPALDPHSGRCELYESRPIACRTYGPPLRHEGQPSQPCGLCFRGADAGTVERCRFEPDREGLERTILTRLGVAPGEEWETLIALALAPETAC